MCIFDNYRYLCLCHILQNTFSSHILLYTAHLRAVILLFWKSIAKYTAFILLFDMLYPAKLIYKCALSYKLTFFGQIRCDTGRVELLVPTRVTRNINIIKDDLAHQEARINRNVLSDILLRMERELNSVCSVEKNECIVFDVLSSMFCLRCFVFDVLSSMFCLRCFVFDVLSSMFCLRCFVFDVLSSMFCLRCFVFDVLSSMFCLRCFVFDVLSSMFCLRCFVFDVLSSMFCLRCFVFDVLSSMFCLRYHTSKL